MDSTIHKIAEEAEPCPVIREGSFLRTGPVRPRSASSGVLRPLQFLVLSLVFFALIQAQPLLAQSTSPAEPGSPSPATQAPKPVPPQMTREEIYEKVFHTPMPKIAPQRFWVYAVVNGKFCCKVEMDWAGEPTAGLFDPVPLLKVLSGMLKPEIMKSVNEAAPKAGFMDTSSLHALGIETEVDPATFRFFLRVPPRLLVRSARSLSGGRIDPFTAGGKPPEPFSAFINWSAQQQYDDPPSNGGSERGPLGVGLDGAFQLKGWVLEGAGLYKEGNEDEWSRRDVRLVKDLAPRALRFSGGDLSYQVSGYQSVMSLGGIGVSRDYSLKPHEITYPTGDFSFYLENPSTVEIWINGVLRNTLELEAGDQDLRDFPFVSGENEVELRIRDAAGRRQTLNFSFIREAILLSRGRDRFSFNAGVMRKTIGSGYEYDGDEPGASLYYQRGLTDRFTAGGFLQARSHHAVLGCDAAMAFGFGTFQMDAAASALENYGEDWAGRLSFTSRRIDLGLIYDLRWRVYAEYLGENFATVANSAPYNRQKVKTAASTTFRLPNDLTANMGLGCDLLRDSEATESYYATAGVSWRLRQCLAAGLSARYAVDPDGRSSSEAYLGISLYWPQKGQSLTASKAWDGGVDARWDWQTSSSGNPGAARGYVSAGRDDDTDELEAGASYTSNLGRASVTHEITERRSGDGETFNRTLLALQSSIVFADGNFGISRPVRDSFLLVKGVENCEGRKILVNPTKNGAQAESLLFLPAVVPDLYSYRLANVRCEPEEPPLTYIPKEAYSTLFPSYKSGTVLYVGTTARFQVLGRLVDEKGEPVKELPCEIQFPKAEGGNNELTFTDSLGRFLVMAPGSGPCVIRPLSPESPYGQASFEVPVQSEGMYRAGDIILPVKTNGGPH